MSTLSAISSSLLDDSILSQTITVLTTVTSFANLSVRAHSLESAPSWLKESSDLSMLLNDKQQYDWPKVSLLDALLFKGLSTGCFDLGCDCQVFQDVMRQLYLLPLCIMGDLCLSLLDCGLQALLVIILRLFGSFYFTTVFTGRSLSLVYFFPQSTLPFSALYWANPTDVASMWDLKMRDRSEGPKQWHPEIWAREQGVNVLDTTNEWTPQA